MSNRDQDNDAMERAEELQMDASLAELGGLAPDPSLVDRILGLDDVPPAFSPVSNRRRNSPLVAAAILVGVGVVAGIAYLQSGGFDDQAPAAAPMVPQPESSDGAPTGQDPKATRPLFVPTTLIADYSENRLIEVNRKGEVIWLADDVFGAWDVELLPNDNLLVTEFSVSRVSEIDRRAKVVWSFEDLKNPYCAQRLKNGNTLIADTFAGRVIEIDRDGNLVWQFANNIRPFDAERMPNGHVLIADVLADRVIEVDRLGNVVWQLDNVPQAHDADSLPNGNVLVTLRNRGAVCEYDRDGKLVWEKKGLSSPSDADRLPNGNTLVAENQRVREYDKDGMVIWQRKAKWAVEANRLWRRAKPNKDGKDASEESDGKKE